MGLLHVLTRLGLPLLGGSKLCGHICSQPGLLGKVIPYLLCGHIGIYSGNKKQESEEEEDWYQKYENTKTREERRKPSEYLGSRYNDFT